MSSHERQNMYFIFFNFKIFSNKDYILEILVCTILTLCQLPRLNLSNRNILYIIFVQITFGVLKL